VAFERFSGTQQIKMDISQPMMRSDPLWNVEHIPVPRSTGNLREDDLLCSAHRALAPPLKNISENTDFEMPFRPKVAWKQVLDQ
jgi:hypothetical protein